MFTHCKEIGLTLEDVAGELPDRWRVSLGDWSKTTMRKTTRKILALLDEEQREALLELADFGLAAFSAGLAVAVLKGAVDVITSFI